jgi:hypothetical protein
LFQNRAEHATQIKIKTQTLQNVFQTHLPPDTDIDFMSVDCEGHDLEVLQSNDWQKYRPRVLLVEDHEQRSGVSLEEQLSEWGYRYLCTMRITKFFIATDDRRPRRV